MCILYALFIWDEFLLLVVMEGHLGWVSTSAVDPLNFR